MTHDGLDINPEVVTELLVSFLREEVGTAKMSRAVVGLSGGVDSAVTAALCARAFGPKNVLCVLMPYRTSDPRSEAHASLVLDGIGAESRRIEITEMADGYFDASGCPNDARRGNVMARCRMIVLYDMSVEWGGLVVGTSNKTEILLGYSTQWGDAASAVNPLGDLYKHQIYQLARHLELPSEVIEKAPSADLFEGQTDEGDLGFSYESADELLYRMVDERYNHDDLIREGFDSDFVRQIAARVVGNQFKRLPPVIAKLSRRSVSHDFRYLRDWRR